MDVRVVIDGTTILDKTFKPSGVSGNGRISGLEFLKVKSGTHLVEVFIRDDSPAFRMVFSGEVVFEKGKVHILAYNDKTDEFVLR